MTSEITAPPAIEIEGQRRQFRVPAARLVPGQWNHQESGQIGEGDIHAAYSADLIALRGGVRAPFTFRRNQWTTTANHRRGESAVSVAYRLIPASLFTGPSCSYRDKTRHDGGAAARRDLHGFYHGMTVRRGKTEYVLAGPPAEFAVGESETVQASLFEELL